MHYKWVGKIIFSYIDQINFFSRAEFVQWPWVQLIVFENAFSPSQTVSWLENVNETVLTGLNIPAADLCTLAIDVS